MGRTGCCCKNFAQMNPSTGAINWLEYVPGDGVGSCQSIVRVEPLRGTNDLLVMTQNSTQVFCSLCRVNNSGQQIWCFSSTVYGGTTYYPCGVYLTYTQQRRIFGSDGTYIVVLLGSGSNPDNNQDAIAGLDYNGNVLWVVQFASAGAGSLVVSSAGALNSSSASGATLTLYNTSTGAVVSTHAALNSTWAPDYPLAVGQITGDFTVSCGPTFGTPVAASSSYAVIASLPNAITGAPQRVGATGNLSVNAGNVWLFSLATGLIFSVSSTHGPTSVPIDTDNDSTGVYICGTGVVGGSGSWNNVVKYNMSGTFVWGNTPGFKALSCYGMAVGGDSNLYVGGA